MDLESLQSGANSASQQASSMAASLPSVLQELKGSLNEIFNKDNPLVQERTGHLENYLSAGDRARANYLPQNSGFAYSPTELNALVSSTKASALAPLASVNQMLIGQYGGLKDYLGQAKDVFQARVTAAYENAQRQRQLYQDAIAEQARQDALKQQAFENDLALRKLKQAGSGLGLSGLGSSNTGQLNTFIPGATTMSSPIFQLGPVNPNQNNQNQDSLWQSFVNTLYGRENTPEDQTVRNPLARGIRAAASNFWNHIQGK